MCGNLSKFIIEFDQHLIKGSKIPVADALEMSVTCFPIQKNIQDVNIIFIRFLKDSKNQNKRERGRCTKMSIKAYLLSYKLIDK